MRVGGQVLAVTMRTPGNDVDLVHGFLLSEGVIATRDDVSVVRYCDGVEVANAANGALNDAYALRYAKHYGLGMTAGSDNHHSFEGFDPANRIMGIALDQKLNSIDDLVRRILNKQPIGLHVPKERWQVAEDETQVIESFFLDEKECLQPANMNWLELG